MGETEREEEEVVVGVGVLEEGGGERMSLRLTSASSGLWSEVRRVLGLGYLPESLLPVTLHHIRTAPTAREGKCTHHFSKKEKIQSHTHGTVPRRTTRRQ